MPFTPETPGKDMVFDKPGIPTPAWRDEEKEISHAAGGTAVFKGEFTYQDSEAGIVLNNLNVKGYYIQHKRSGTFTSNTSIRAYYNNELIMENYMSLDSTKPHSSAEMFIRSGMWVGQSTIPVSDMNTDSAVEGTFSRALTKDEPYITDLILGTDGASSGTYRVWIYE